MGEVTGLHRTGGVTERPQYKSDLIHISHQSFILDQSENTKHGQFDLNLFLI